MKSRFSSAVCATAMLFSSVAASAILSPAFAQSDVSIDFNAFHDQLAPYGDWVYSDRWGEVWMPNVSSDFHPYGTHGHWVDTEEYGWTWQSGYRWGDIPFHYGRWVNDPDDGWLWIAGYVWSPGWVVWRSNGQYTGWMPMPPDDAFLSGDEGGRTSIGVSIGGLSLRFNNNNDDYGYSRWYGRGYDDNRFASNWLFIGTGHIGDRDYSRSQAPRRNYTNLIRTSTNTTNYTVVNNYVVNRSVDSRAVEHAGGHVQTVRAAVVFQRPQFITRADTGHDVQLRMRQERPRGTGIANSAPAPTATVVLSLSNKVTPHGGHAPAHLFTRDTVKTAPLTPLPTHGGPGAAPATPATSPVVEPGKPERGGHNHGPETPVTAAPNVTPANVEPGKTETGGKHGGTGTPAMTAPNAAPANAEPGKPERGRNHGPETPVTTTPNATPTNVEPGKTETGGKHSGTGTPMTTPTSTPVKTAPSTLPSSTVLTPTGAETGKHEHRASHGETPQTPATTSPVTPAPSKATTAPTNVEPGSRERGPKHVVAPETPVTAPASNTMAAPTGVEPATPIRGPKHEAPVTPSNNMSPPGGTEPVGHGPRHVTTPQTPATSPAPVVHSKPVPAPKAEPLKPADEKPKKPKNPDGTDTPQ